MRQVPHYLIIGRGRLACHIKHYFCLLNLSYSEWHRGLSFEALHAVLPAATHILILINDDAIQTFLNIHLKNLPDTQLIHCSGRLNCDLAVGVHPLMTFSHTLYSLKDYQEIVLVVEEGAPSLEILLPGLSNQVVYIPKQLKEKYHALCALSGNLTCFLWQQLFDRFERELNLPKSIAFPYLKQQMINLLTDATTALTGPLARGDHHTVRAHLQSLEHDPLKKIYAGFINSFFELRE